MYAWEQSTIYSACVIKNWNWEYYCKSIWKVVFFLQVKTMRSLKKILLLLSLLLFINLIYLI